ncbi:MAG: lysine--tRNA ligase [Acidobacteriaceae bacterium]
MPQYDSQFEENLYQLRRDKLAQIAALARAANPALTEPEARYPNTFRFTTSVPELRALGEHLSTEELEAMHLQAAVAGRIMAIRVQGKAGFAQIQQHGQRLQIYVRKDDVGEDQFALYKLLDLGDHIGVRGYLMRTRTGELTLHVAPITFPNEEAASEESDSTTETPAVRVAPVRAAPIHFLTKAMLALPDKFHGLEDIELRYRRRYLDLFTDTGDTPEPAENPADAQNAVILSEAKDPRILPEAAQAPPEPTQSRLPARLPARAVFTKRAHILRSIRHYFDRHGYLEVETPMLHTVAGGAAARPFTTHHNTLDMQLNLRIAPELYLKRLVVGGFDRVYEINRNFRNEGVSTQHNPEFTMLEFYQAYANYHDLMDLTQDLITTVAKEVNGTTLTNFNGTEIDLSKWTRLSMREAIIKFWPKEYGAAPSKEDFEDRRALGAVAMRVRDDLGGALPAPRFPGSGQPEIALRSIQRGVFTLLSEALVLEKEPIGKTIATLFEHIAEPHLIQPTIIYDYPLAVSPLSKIKPDEPDWVERFEFYIGGFELGNGFSELNDPDDQQRRFEAQLEDRKRGDIEAMAEVDDDYVRALGYGLPPTAGEGIGIDRLTMILTGSRSIRDVILFPLMRPQKPTQETSENPDPTNPQPHGESAE